MDSGNRQKLEQFGPYILIRPEPAAYWLPRMTPAEWRQMAWARFVPDTRKQSGLNRGGKWEHFQSIPESWPVWFEIGHIKLQFLITPSPFGHVGLFPEQLDNWNFISSKLKKAPSPLPKVLNIFAYTGAASVVARAAGADVIHVDSSRSVLRQARQNMEINGLSGIRWVYEDAFKFVHREQKRGRYYSGIIMDPPPAGRGPSGERWKLSEQLDSLLTLCDAILEPKNAFLVFSFYAVDWSHQDVKSQVAQRMRGKVSSGNCMLPNPVSKKSLALGSFVRVDR